MARHLLIIILLTLHLLSLFCCFQLILLFLGLISLIFHSSSLLVLFLLPFDNPFSFSAYHLRCFYGSIYLQDGNALSNFRYEYFSNTLDHEANSASCSLLPSFLASLSLSPPNPSCFPSSLLSNSSASSISIPIGRGFN